MLVWLLDHFAPLMEKIEIFSSGDSRVFLTARTALASLTAFLIAILLGPTAIRWLQARFRERVVSGSARLNEIQASKNATPTMGGLFIMAAILISILMWGNLHSPFVLVAIFVVVGFSVLGAIDDWVKLKGARNGLRAKEKFVVQLVLAGTASLLLYWHHRQVPQGLDLFWPFGEHSIYLGVGFILWGAFVMVGSSNAVNLTDGLDGLACGCMVFAGSAFVALCYMSGHREMSEYLSVPYIAGAGEMSVVLGAMVGAVMGFLWFNCYPAQVFMGDTGSLPMGALLGLAALVIRQELLLVIVGGVFVIETLSVISQVGWFRMTGRRLIACSPLHNHFLFHGHHEMKIVVRFWISSALLAIIAVASLKIH
ncbi:phospho-N-acetylmuramoyl-pentapeptide-transferase [Symmachiella dynata]|uniref:phospho-N-acetylmuramoyl-pentapeptide- transferase n=1 Tax=Symmachiella dynata TaxID=2527995 RepID=UPI0030EDAA67